MVAADAGDGEWAARLLGHADHLRTEAGGTVPAFLCDDLDRTRTHVLTLLGADAFEAELELGRHGRLAHEVALVPSRSRD